METLRIVFPSASFSSNVVFTVAVKGAFLLDEGEKSLELLVPGVQTGVSCAKATLPSNTAVATTTTKPILALIRMVDLDGILDAVTAARLSKLGGKCSISTAPDGVAEAAALQLLSLLLLLFLR